MPPSVILHIYNSSFTSIDMHARVFMHHPHLCAAPLCHMADDDVDADVTAASQHPWFSRAAIFLLFELIDGAEASSGLSSLLLPQSLTDAPLSTDAPARSAPLLKLRLNPSSHVGFSMYGCARKKDAVGWPKIEWNKKQRSVVDILEGGTSGSWRCFEWAEDSTSAVVESELLR